MRVLLYEHEACTRHDAGAWHPERPSRLVAVADGVEMSGLDVVRREAPRADIELLHLIHAPGYVRAIEEFCRSGGGSLDPDTAVVVDSWEAALRASGAGPAAVEALRSGQGDLAFLSVRPPGHHAERSRALGFCLFNNIAITAEMLRRAGERVAIVDFDVHHGNGTQQTFYGADDVLYLSIHEFPAYPGTGWLEESGEGGGTGTTVNLPVPTGSGGAIYRRAFDRVFGPVLRQFRPDWLLVSAGYDAHRDDPLAGIELVAADYRYISATIATAAPHARTIYFLEGGYHLDAMARSVAATLQGAAGARPEADGVERAVATAGWRLLDRLVETMKAHWDIA